MDSQPFEKYSNEARHVFVYTGDVKSAESSPVIKKLLKDFRKNPFVEEAVNAVLANYEDTPFAAISPRYKRILPGQDANLEIRIQSGEVQKRFLALGIPEGDFCDYILLQYYPKPHGGSDRIPPKMLREANKQARYCKNYIEGAKK